MFTSDEQISTESASARPSAVHATASIKSKILSQLLVLHRRFTHFQSASSLLPTNGKQSSMSIGSVNAKTPVRSPTPKNNFPPPPSPWSKGCLRPHAPLRARQQGPPGTHISASTGNNPMGSPIPSSGSGLGMGDGTNAANESGSNRTLKRFMTMKKSKANEFLKRGKTFFH